MDKQKIEVGRRIHIDYVKGEPQMSGLEGVITFIDDIGQLFGTWCGIAVCAEYGDRFHIIEDKCNEAEVW